MNIIECKIKHIPALCELVREFIQESNWGFTHDSDVCSLAFYDYILSEESIVLAAEIDNKLVAFAVAVTSKDFCAEMQGFLNKFYVSANYRKTRAAILLTQHLAAWFDSRGCVYSFATSTSGISDRAICTFSKLMRKYGFEDCGPTLARGLYGKI